MVQKYCSLLKRRFGGFGHGELRFYDDKKCFEQGLIDVNRSKSIDLEAIFCFNGESSCEEVIEDFKKEIPSAKEFEIGSLPVLRVPPEDYSLLESKFVDYFQELGPLAVKRESSLVSKDITVGEYYDKYLKKK